MPKVKLIEYPSEQTIFVAIDHLRKCYPEQPNDCWLGKKKIPKKKAKQPSSEPAVVPPQGPPIDEEASHLETGR